MRFFPILCIALALALSACGSAQAPAGPEAVEARAASVCTPGGGAFEITGSVFKDNAKSYRVIPFNVGAGTGRVELSYNWTERSPLPSTPLTATTLDLGLWDQHGYRVPEGFRGWSGSRQGRLDRDQAPVFVEASGAERGYVPGTIEPGTWYADLGIAAVAPLGADWTVKIECKAAGGATPPDDPVDRDHIARAVPGWYLGDFHMHAYHSNANAPDWDGFIAQARAGRLDFLMVTEYVTGAHWKTLGAVQRAHPDLVIWPGREIITYYGHATSHGETPSVLEYRHGFEDVRLGEIQLLAKDDGALFQINHPTSFPGPVFANFCRGCQFTIRDQIDWDLVDTIEVQNGPPIVNSTDVGLPAVPAQMENPFTSTAILLWDEQLRKGHRITAVSGSDSKGVDAPQERARKGYGSSATAVYASSLSRAALTEAIQAGHAYVRVRGAADSPEVEFEAFGPNGQHGIYGDTLSLGALQKATLRTTVKGGKNQLLAYFQNGIPLLTVPVLGDPFVHQFKLATRNPLTEGPLGTYWRIELRDLKSRTIIGNPVFLKGG